MLKKLLYAVSLFLPWPLRRRWLAQFFGYELHPTARIGKSWVQPVRLVMAEGSRIGSGTVCKGLSLVDLGKGAYIGNLNWITGLAPNDERHFRHQPERRPELRLEPHASITNRHLIDCTDAVSIGSFSTLAGFRSQILTHSINLAESRQDSKPVRIGDYCFVGTDCVLLGGSVLPNRSVLGAKSLLNKVFAEENTLYGGVPAKAVQPLPTEGMRYFQRAEGWVD